jgi:non-ribosomal peptide synthetase component F
MHPGVFAAKEPDRPAVIMGTAGTVVTYAELEARSNQVAWLARLRGSRGDLTLGRRLVRVHHRLGGLATRVEGAAPGQLPGLWTNLRVRCAALSTAITKHTRSGPRLGNGAPVYLTEIGSM